MKDRRLRRRHQIWIGQCARNSDLIIYAVYRQEHINEERRIERLRFNSSMPKSLVNKKKNYFTNRELFAPNEQYASKINYLIFLYTPKATLNLSMSS